MGYCQSKNKRSKTREASILQNLETLSDDQFFKLVEESLAFRKVCKANCMLRKKYIEAALQKYLSERIYSGWTYYGTTGYMTILADFVETEIHWEQHNFNQTPEIPDVTLSFSQNSEE